MRPPSRSPCHFERSCSGGSVVSALHRDDHFRRIEDTVTRSRRSGLQDDDRLQCSPQLPDRCVVTGTSASCTLAAIAPCARTCSSSSSVPPGFKTRLISRSPRTGSVTEQNTRVATALSKILSAKRTPSSVPLLCVRSFTIISSTLDDCTIVNYNMLCQADYHCRLDRHFERVKNKQEQAAGRTR